jgi:hypothetical protein
MTINVVHATAYTTQSPTIPATTGPSHSLIVAVGVFEDVGAPSISGITIGGTAMTAVGGKTVISSGVYGGAWIYYLSNVATGKTALAVSGSNLSINSPDGYVAAIEVDCPIALDKTNNNSGTSGSMSTGTTGTLSTPEEFAVGVLGTYEPSDTAGWTDVSTTDSLISYKQVSATTALNLTASNPASAPWAGLIATFKRSGSLITPGAFMDFLI